MPDWHPGPLPPAPGTSPVEGINNKIKVVKRVAYGYRDDACFFLKIRAAFPRTWVKNQVVAHARRFHHRIQLKEEQRRSLGTKRT